AAAITVRTCALAGMVNTEADGAALWLEPAAYGTVGHTVWQHFSVRFGRGFRATSGEWNFIAQWHDDTARRKFPYDLDFEYANLCWMIRTVNGVPRVGMRIIGGLSTSPRTVRVNG